LERLLLLLLRRLWKLVCEKIKDKITMNTTIRILMNITLLRYNVLFCSFVRLFSPYKGSFRYDYIPKFC